MPGIKGKELKPWIERFYDRIEITDACWNWIGGRTDGYGYLFVVGRKRQKAHRLSWELHVGPIPEGLCIDHLCRNRACVNPDHLEPVTLAENTRRQLAAVGHANALRTHCAQGHEFDGSTVLSRGLATRVCRVCRRDANRRYRSRRAAA